MVVRVKQMILSELKLGDVVQYWWSGRWENFKVVKIEEFHELVHSSGVNYRIDYGGAESVRIVVELWSPTLQRSAFNINQSTVDKGHLRWPLNEDEKTALVKEQLAVMGDEIKALRAALAAVEKRYTSIKATLS